MIQSKNAIAIPPGETIREMLDGLGMSQKDFAIRMDLSEKHISHLINGKVELTPQVTLRLEYVLGMPSSFWSKLEASYREAEVRVKEEIAIEEDAEIARQIPYNDAVKLGWLPETSSIVNKVKNLRSFFGVVRLVSLALTRISGISYRQLDDSGKTNYSLAVWVQQARIESRKLNVEPIDLKLLEELLPQIRNLTITKPDYFCRKLTEDLGRCGVKVVFLPHLVGSFVQGAAFCDGHSVVLALTVRGRDADKFWFSLFHELCHILYKHIFLDSYASVDNRILEEEADRFASDYLIPPDEYERLTCSYRFTKDNILAFAENCGIQAGIVVGRLQKDKLLPYSRLNQLKEQYEIG